MDIFLTRSRDGGRTWSTPTSVYHGYALGSIPAVGPDGTIYVGFSGAAPFGTAPSCPTAVGTVAGYRLQEMEMVVATSHDDAKTWSYERRGLCEAAVLGTVRATELETADATGGWFVGSIGVDPSTGRVYAVWPTFAPALPAVTYGVQTMSSADGGRTWSPTKLLSAPGGDAVLPAVTSAGGVARAIWIATTDHWDTYDAYWSESGDGGGTWSAPAKLSTQSGSGESEIGDYISLTSLGDRVAAIWTQRRGGAATDIFVRTTAAAAVVAPSTSGRPGLAPTGAALPVALAFVLLAVMLASRRVGARR
jgi:hypothetical protein